jgi:iron complex outermembrane receptor protein
LLGDVPLSATTFLPTTGKTLVETPEWTLGTRLQWAVTPDWDLGLQGKYVGDRFATDVNDEIAPSYTVFDLDTEYKLHAFGKDNTTLQLNILNIFNADYVGSISSTNNAKTIADVNPNPAVTTAKTGSSPLYYVGTPRTVMFTLKTKF